MKWSCPLTESGIFPERSAYTRESGVACLAFMKLGNRAGTDFGFGFGAFAMWHSLHARMKNFTWESNL